VPTFEDRVIFAHDVEQCLTQLEWFAQQLLARIVFQEHSFEDAARLLHTSERTVRRRFPAAVDALSEILLRKGLMRPDPCQEGNSGPFAATDSSGGE
jgi:DNA-directed RNA polymerase specialized sigma24 family protein